MDENTISRIPIFDAINNGPEGLTLSVTSAATIFLSKYKNNNILPICVCQSHSQEVLKVLLKSQKQRLPSPVAAAADDTSTGISLLDRVIPLKNDGVILLIEVPDESIAINPAEGQNALAYIQLAFSMYIAKYTLLSEKPNYNVELSMMQIKREFLQVDEAEGRSAETFFSTNFGDIEEFKEKVEFQAKRIGGNPLKGEVLLYMVYEFQQALSGRQSIDVKAKFENHCVIFMNKLRDEQWNAFLKKSRAQISENNYPYEEAYIHARINEAEAEVLNEFDARAGEFAFTLHLLSARKGLLEKISSHREDIVQNNATISEEFCTNLIVNIYEHFNSNHAQMLSDEGNSIASDSLLTQTTLLEKHVLFQDLLNMYLQHAKGPYKYRLLAETQTKFTFGFFEGFFAVIQEHFTQQIVQQKAMLYEAEERLKESEQKLFTAEKQKIASDEELQRVNRQMKENSALESSKLLELQLLDGYNQKQLEQLTKKIEKKNEKMSRILDESNRLILDSRRLKEELADKDFMLKTLKEKLNKYEDLTATAFKSTAIHQIPKPYNDLAYTLQEFKQYVRRAEDSIVKIATERESFASNTHEDVSGIQRRDKEIEALKEERNQLRQKIEATRMEERKIFADERVVLEEQINQMTREKNQLMEAITRWKIMELEFNQTKKIMEEQVKCLEAEKKKYEATFDFLDQYRKNYEEQSEQIFHIEQQLIEAKTLSGDQDIIIDNLYHLLPQLILHLRQKPNKLFACLKNLSEYTTQVAQILQDNGVKIN